MGGRAAEEVFFGEMTTGAGNDLEQATTLARAMVTRYGMSAKLGPRTFGKREELIFLGKEIWEQRDYGEKASKAIDEEVHSLLDKAYQVAKNLIISHKEILAHLANYLIEHETAEGDLLDQILNSTLVPFVPNAGFADKVSPGTTKGTRTAANLSPDSSEAMKE
jgi:cell division protease FtsH